MAPTIPAAVEEAKGPAGMDVIGPKWEEGVGHCKEHCGKVNDVGTQKIFAANCIFHAVDQR
jgi:hypothetical protein